MKTIAALLVTLLLIALSGFFTSLTIETLLDSNQTYIGQQTNEVYQFRLVLLISAFLLTILAIGCIITASITGTIFYNNYLRILQRRRDNHIKRELLNAKYDKLYEELNNTNIYEEKEKIVKDFYQDTKIKGIKQMMDDLIKDMQRKDARTRQDKWQAEGRKETKDSHSKMSPENIRPIGGMSAYSE